MEKITDSLSIDKKYSNEPSSKLRTLARATTLAVASLYHTGCNDENPPSDKTSTHEIGTAWNSGNPNIIQQEDGSTNDKELKQFFKLGEHDVLSADKISKKFVTLVTGSVDVTPYTMEEKPASFYNELYNACELLLQIYKFNYQAFTPEALRFITSNLPLLEALNIHQPNNHSDFKKALSVFKDDAVYGPDGVLNLILAFNRVTSKLEAGTLENVKHAENELFIKIDLRKRETRSVEISVYEPQIKEPDISKIKLDLRGMEKNPETRLKPDGTYIVKRWYKDFKGVKKLAYELEIDSQNRTIKATRYFHLPGPISNTMTFASFNNKFTQDPFALHRLR